MNTESFSARITRYFIQSPLTPLLLIAIIFMGIMALINLPREEEPQISVPMVDIFVHADGLKASDAKELITKPLESIVKAIPGVEHTYSQTMDDDVIVTARFFVGSSADEAVLRVHDKIRAHLSEIPYGIKMPAIIGKGIDDVAIVVMTLSPKAYAVDRWNDIGLYEMALQLQAELIKTENVGSSYVVGGRPRQLRIEPMPERLSLYGITLDQLITKITNADRSLIAGSVRDDNAYLTVLAGRTLQSTTDLGGLLLTTRSDHPVYLKDVAKIVADGKPLENRVWFMPRGADGKAVPAVSIAFAKRPGSNAVVIADEMQERLGMLKGSLIPNDVDVTITRDYGKTASEKSNRLMEDLVGATLSVILLASIAIGWREGIVVMIVIPATILATLFVAWISGFTINRVSLFALIFSIGILVDDAIVFTENIVRRWRNEPEADKIQTAINAVVEVGNPTIMATFTIVVALLPMLFVSGLMGPYMSPIPINASVAMILSLVVAFTMVPWLLLKLHKNISKEVTLETEGFLGSLYRRVAVPIITDRKKSKLMLQATAIATLLACGLFFTKSVVVKMLPFDNKSEMLVQVDLKEGSTLESTERTMREISAAVESLPELENMQLYVGVGAPFNFNGLVRHSYLRNQSEMGELQINLLPKSERNRTSHKIALDIRKRLKGISLPDGAVVKVLEVPPGPPVLSTLLAEVYGPSPEARRDTAEKVKQAFGKVNFVTDIDDSYGALHDRLRLTVDTDKLEYYGVEEQVVYDTLKALLGGMRVGYSHKGGGVRPIEIAIELPKSGKTMDARLLSTPVINDKGKIVELGELVTISVEPSSYRIFRHNGYDTDMILGELAGEYEAPLYAMFAVDDVLKSMEWGESGAPHIAFHGQPLDESKASILWDGEWEITYVTFRDMGIAFIVALIGIYVLLVMQFRSFRTPVVVLVPVPLVLLGIILGHWIMGVTFTATSMIGMIALAGIVVRNSLLLVEFIRHQLALGVPLVEALIEAGSIRITPILLTAIAAMTGAVFMFFDPIFEGMAVSLFFGLMSSTVLTLLAIPAVYIVAKTKE